MRKIKNLSILLLLISSFSLIANNEDSLKVQPLQISFITPMGTNGVNSHKYINNMSFNILAGYNGGLQGVEAAGVFNMLRYDMEGCQIAGTGNAVMGNSTGIQIAGTFNFNYKNLEGMQIAGITNYTTKGSDIVQIAGINNVILDSLKGMQVSGINNFSMSMHNAVQISGISNFNIKNAQGAQIAGIANLSGGDITGVQAAGIANLGAKRVEGVQLSGMLNIANDLNGVQIGFINFVDSLEDGLPIGFFSFVGKNGYRKLELSSSESFHLGMSFKTGVPKFYNIFSLGARNYNDDFVWAFGYGIGTTMNLKDKMSLNLDLINYHLNHNEYWTDELNMLNKLELTFNYEFHKHFSVFAGGSLNMFISELYDSEGFPVEQTPSPFTIYQMESNETIMKIYPGFKFGIRI